MGKNRKSVKLSLVLLRFVFKMGVLMAAALVMWYSTMLLFQHWGWVLPAYTAERQVRQFIEEQAGKEHFNSQNAPPAAHYLLIDADGNVLITVNYNNHDKMLKHYLSGEEDGAWYARHTYPDGNTVLLTWRYLAEFSNQTLRFNLPPFEYLWYGMLVVLLMLCVQLATSSLRRQLVEKLQMLEKVGTKVGQQELDFETPDTGIKEFDDVMGALDGMRIALKESLSVQWAAERQRQEEIAALAHDLKTPLTIIGGNADLMMEEPLTATQHNLIAYIHANTLRAQQYVAALGSVGTMEQEVSSFIDGEILLSELLDAGKALASQKGVSLVSAGLIPKQFYGRRQLLERSLINLLENAVNATPAGSQVVLKIEENQQGRLTFIVKDNGAGFSAAALAHATERFWKDDSARGDTSHRGIGLWFANRVAQLHGGKLQLYNDMGGVAVMDISVVGVQ